MAWDFISGHFCARRFHLTLSRELAEERSGRPQFQRERKRKTLGLSVGAPSRGYPQHIRKPAADILGDIFLFRLDRLLLLHKQHDMKTSLQFFCAGLSCFILLVFLIFYGYQIIPFESIWAEIVFGCLLIIGAAVFLAQGIWLYLTKKFE